MRLLYVVEFTFAFFSSDFFAELGVLVFEFIFLCRCIFVRQAELLRARLYVVTIKLTCELVDLCSFEFELVGQLADALIFVFEQFVFLDQLEFDMFVLSELGAACFVKVCFFCSKCFAFSIERSQSVDVVGCNRRRLC